MSLEQLATDSKVFFDYLRNVGICAVLTLSVPEFNIILSNMNFNWSMMLGGWAERMFVFMSLSMIAILYIINAIWLYYNMKSKPFSKSTNVISALIIFPLVTTIFAATTTYKALFSLGLLS